MDPTYKDNYIVKLINIIKELVSESTIKFNLNFKYLKYVYKLTNTVINSCPENVSNT